LVAVFPLGAAIVGEAAQKHFVAIFGAILRLRTILTAFDDFAGNELLTERDYQDYQSIYLNLYAEFRRADAAEKESINDDVVFEIELIKQVEVNVDYVLMLVAQWREARGNGSDREMDALMKIQRAVDSSVSLRNKKDLIISFVDAVNVTGDVNDDWKRFVAQRRDAELEDIITAEGLKPEETRAFVDAAFRDGAVPTAGTAITRILPPTSRFSAANNHAAKKQTVMARLVAFFDRYFALV